MIRWNWTVALGLFFAACGASGGTVPVSECTTDEDCVRIAQEVNDALLAPTDRSLTFDSASCEPNGLRTSGACMCTVAEGMSGTWSFTLGARVDCDRYGRSGNCIVSVDDFLGCDVATENICDAPCTSAVAAIQADEDATFDAEIRTATCVPNTDADNVRMCHTVYRVDDRCYAGTLLPYGPNQAYDCALTNEAIIQLETARIAMGG